MTLDQETQGSNPCGAALKSLIMKCNRAFFVFAFKKFVMIFSKNGYGGGMDMGMDFQIVSIRTVNKEKNHVHCKKQ
jgi:hypothetical protein